MDNYELSEIKFYASNAASVDMVDTHCGYEVIFYDENDKETHSRVVRWAEGQQVADALGLELPPDYDFGDDQGDY